MSVVLMHLKTPRCCYVFRDLTRSMTNANFRQLLARTAGTPIRVFCRALLVLVERLKKIGKPFKYDFTSLSGNISKQFLTSTELFLSSSATIS